MATDADRTRLLAEYNAAAGEERALWKKMQERQTDAVDYVQTYARWKAAAERSRNLSMELQAQPVSAALPPG